jgi:protein-disulfide isomerase
MHQRLFANQKALDAQSLEKYAREIGLDVPAWKQALANPKLQEMVRQDQALAASLGATGTPAFFINGRRLSGAQPSAVFKRVIDEELTKAEAMVKDGVRPDQVYAKIMEKVSAAPAQAAADPAPAEVKKVDIPAGAPSHGPKHAKVTVVAFSDFQCPYCSRAVPTLKKIEQTYGKDVRVVFRHQALPFHNNAKLAAEASMAAHEQGKFWPYHDKLFANQGSLDRASLEKYARELGLDLEKFKRALDSGKFRSAVEADSAAGSALGASGTPTFFVNGRLIVGAQPFESFKPIIDEEIKRADKLLASGTKPEKLYEKLQEAAQAMAGAGSGTAAPAVQKIALGSAPVKGPKNAPVTIVVFSDFQCPYCSRAVPTLKAIEQQYGSKVKLAFKHQPLPIHQNARLAAAASLAANEQGKFWPYHDKLFENQQALDRASLEKYAQQLDLNMPKFKAALDSNKFDAQISADSSEGALLGANATPTFFINGRQLVGAQPVDAFKVIIDEELKKPERGPGTKHAAAAH